MIKYISKILKKLLPEFLYLILRNLQNREAKNLRLGLRNFIK